MAGQLTPDTLRRIALGRRVNRAAATIPATTHTAIFTITGGRILVTSILGEVTTLIQTQTDNAKLTSYPTTGTAVDLCTATNITAKEVGAFMVLPAAVGSALIVANAGAIVCPLVGLFLPIGAIHFDCSATNTGAVKWTMTYVPIDDGASVAAA